MSLFSQHGKLSSRRAPNYTLLAAFVLLLLCVASPLLVDSRYLSQTTRLDASLNQRRTATYKWVAEQEATAPTSVPTSVQPEASKPVVAEPETTVSNQPEQEASQDGSAPVEANPPVAGQEDQTPSTGEQASVEPPRESSENQVQGPGTQSEPEAAPESVPVDQNPGAAEVKPEEATPASPEQDKSQAVAVESEAKLAQLVPTTTQQGNSTVSLLPTGPVETTITAQQIPFVVDKADVAPKDTVTETYTTPPANSQNSEVPLAQPTIVEQPNNQTQQASTETKSSESEKVLLSSSAEEQILPTEVMGPAAVVAVASVTSENPTEIVAPFANITTGATVEPEATIIPTGTSEASTEPEVEVNQPAPIIIESNELDTREQEEQRAISFDPTSCADLGSLPVEILRMTVDRIVVSLTNKNCSDQIDLRLKASTNKQVRGQVMEVSSVTLQLDELLGASQVNVFCSKPDLSSRTGGPNGTEQVLRLALSLSLDVGNHQLHSRWRTYSSIPLNDIPFNSFDSSSQRSAKNLLESKRVDKCQRFRIEQGDFHLNLLSFRPEFQFQVELVQKSDKEYAIRPDLGGSVRLQHLKVGELYLEHEIEVHSGPRRSSSSLTQLATVQILHDRNNHHRRNNWLLDLYGNWLRHEYKHQLKSLLVGQSLARQLNAVCLVSRANFD